MSSSSLCFARLYVSASAFLCCLYFFSPHHPLLLSCLWQVYKCVQKADSWGLSISRDRVLPENKVTVYYIPCTYAWSWVNFILVLTPCPSFLSGDRCSLEHRKRTCIFVQSLCYTVGVLANDSKMSKLKILCRLVLLCCTIIFRL